MHSFKKRNYIFKVFRLIQRQKNRNCLQNWYTIDPAIRDMNNMCKNFHAFESMLYNIVKDYFECTSKMKKLSVTQFGYDEFSHAPKNAPSENFSNQVLDTLNVRIIGSLRRNKSLTKTIFT